MIKALAAKGGVIQINYERSFIDQAYKDASDKVSGGVVAAFDQFKKECGDDQECLGRKMAEQEKTSDCRRQTPSCELGADRGSHRSRGVKLVGADHVGLGSDFDGAHNAGRNGRLHQAAANHRSADAQRL